MNFKVNRPNTNPPGVMRSTHHAGGLPINVHATSSLAGRDASIIDQEGRAILFANPSPLTRR